MLHDFDCWAIRVARPHKIGVRLSGVTALNGCKSLCLLFPFIYIHLPSCYPLASGMWVKELQQNNITDYMFLFSVCVWNAIELENDAQDFLIKSPLNPHQFCNNQSWNHDSWPSMSPKKRLNKYQVASSFCICSLTNCCAIASSRPHSLNTNNICREMGSWCLFGQNNPMININTFLRRGNVVFFF